MTPVARTTPRDTPGAARPAIVAVAPWAALGWLLGGLLAVVPSVALEALGVRIGDTVWQPSPSGDVAGVLAQIAVLVWGVVIALRFTLARAAWAPPAWTWLIAWAAPLGAALLLPDVVALAAVLAAVALLPVVGWREDGTVRPDPLPVRGGAAWALGAVVPAGAIAAAALAG